MNYHLYRFPHQIFKIEYSVGSKIYLATTVQKLFVQVDLSSFVKSEYLV